jgi:hypothetical protein
MANRKATKKKNKKTAARPKKTAAKPGKKSSGKRKIVKNSALAKKAVPKKKSAASKKLAVPKSKPAKKSKPAAKKLTGVPAAEATAPKVSRRTQRPSDERSSSMESRTRSAGQSGDLQGLSDVDQADSESVDELVEEGNAFEAGVVEGVEEAGDSEGREVHTHEIPEDDVPGEYLDEE